MCPSMNSTVGARGMRCAKSGVSAPEWKVNSVSSDSMWHDDGAESVFSEENWSVSTRRRMNGYEVHM